MSSFAQCSAKDCIHNDGGGCLCYTVDLIPVSIPTDDPELKFNTVICVDYEQCKEEEQ